MSDNTTIKRDPSLIHGEISIKRVGEMIDASVDRRMSVQTTLITNKLDLILASQQKVDEFMFGDKYRKIGFIAEHDRLMDFMNKSQPKIDKLDKLIIIVDKIQPSLDKLIELAEEQDAKSWLIKNYKYFVIMFGTIFMTVLYLIIDKFIVK